MTQQHRDFLAQEQARIRALAEHDPSVVIHTMPIYEGMSIREAWQHVLDAGLGNAVPEFTRSQALGHKRAWVNLRVRNEEELLGAYPAAVVGDQLLCDPDTLDEPWCP
jgi:hypothetical protein